MDEQGAESGHGNVSNQTRGEQHDERHPYTRKDRCPARAGPTDHAERCRAQGTTNRHTAEQSRDEVGCTLGDDVPWCAAPGAIRVGHTLADAGALHDYDQRDRKRAGDYSGSKIRERGQGHPGKTADDLTHIADCRHGIPPQEPYQHRRDNNSHQWTQIA